jgi:hypothetical protein
VALLKGTDGKPSAVEAVAAVDMAKTHPTIRLLHLEVSSQGSQTNLIRRAFGTRLIYLEGVVLSCRLTDSDGRIEKSGVVVRSSARTAKPWDAAHVLSQV